MSFAERTPLNNVRYELWRTTDRNPSSTKAVMAMIREAIGTLGEEESDFFIEGLVKYLDPRDPKKRLGLRNAQHLETLGAVARDKDAVRVERWGALCLLGAVAMTLETEIEDSAPNTAERRSQIASRIAQSALLRVQNSEDTEIGFGDFAGALLAYADISPEDVATELVINGAWDDLHANKAPTPITDDEAIEVTTYGSQIGEPYPLEFTIGDDLQKTLDAMDWLRIDGTIEVDARPVLHDGNKVATIIDLTPYNPTLKELMQDVENDPTSGRQFWAQLGRAVTQAKANNWHTNQVTGSKATTLYMKNKTRSNASVLRAYFTTFGKEEDGTQVIALLAASRTKENEAKALGLLCKTKSPRLSER